MFPVAAAYLFPCDGTFVEERGNTKGSQQATRKKWHRRAPTEPGLDDSERAVRGRNKESDHASLRVHRHETFGRTWRPKHPALPKADSIAPISQPFNRVPVTDLHHPVDSSPPLQAESGLDDLAVNRVPASAS